MNKYITVLFILLATTVSSVAQSRKDSLTTKVVDVVKSYAPTIADATKKRDDAKIKDSLTVKKKEISYTIHSVPVASTFVPEKGKAAVMSQNIVREDSPNSYVGGGFGMANTLYADANISYQVSDFSKFSFLLNHLSSNDNIDNILPETNYSVSGAELRYDFQSQALQWGLNADLGRRLHNWYGIRPNTYNKNDLRGKIDEMQQIYSDYGAGGYLQWENPYFKGIQFSIDGLSDHFNTKELNLKASPSFEVPLTDGQRIHAKMLVDYYESSFSRENNLINSMDNRWMFFGLTPSYQLSVDKLNVKLGLALLYMDANKSSEDKFKAYPDVEASYALSSEAILHAGVRGTMQQNTIEKLSKKNPFLAPMQEIKPTNVQVDAFVGLNGKLSDLQYRLQGSYRKYKEMPLFTTFSEDPLVATAILPYQYRNSFGVVYDELSDFEFLAGVGGKLKDILNFNFEGKLHNYRATQQQGHTAWNLPNIEVSLYTDFKILPNLFAGADLFYVGTRYDLDYVTTATPIAAKLTLEGYIDVNLHADYTFNKHWQVFVKANNLSTQNHTLWAHYPSQGLQIFAGVRYLFSLGKR